MNETLLAPGLDLCHPVNLAIPVLVSLWFVNGRSQNVHENVAAILGAGLAFQSRRPNRSAAHKRGPAGSQGGGRLPQRSSSRARRLADANASYSDMKALRVVRQLVPVYRSDRRSRRLCWAPAWAPLLSERQTNPLRSFRAHDHATGCPPAGNARPRSRCGAL